MDPLEQRFKALQEELQGVEQPDQAAIWNKIRQKREKQRGVLIRLSWRRAAAVALILASVGFGYWWGRRGAPPSEASLIAELPSEWRHRVHSSRAVALRREADLRQNRPPNALAADEFRELHLLDSLHRDFMADLQSLPKDQRTAELFLQYYEQKIRILELISKEIQLYHYEEEKRTQQPL